MRFLLNIVVNGVALWLTTLVLGGVHVEPYADSVLALVLTYALLGVIWGVINATIGAVIRTVGFCFYVITLGLLALVVNGFLFWLVDWVSGLMGFGLSVHDFWWAIFAALLMSIITAILGSITRGLTDSKKRRESARE
ncbi:MAG: phage holin family protein [Pseudoclavibacter sp.]